MRKLLVVLIVVCSISSCDRKIETNIVYFDSFPKSVDIILQEVITPPVTPFIGDMVMLDSTLVVVDLFSDTLFHFFKLPELNYKGGFTRKGVGPVDEVMVFPYLHRMDSSSFMYRTLNDVKVARVHNDTCFVEKNIILPHEFIDVVQLDLVNGNLLFGIDNSRKTQEELVGFDLKNKHHFDFGGEYPDIEFEIESKDYMQVFAKLLAAKEGDSKLAVLYLSFPILRIHNIENNDMIEVRFRNNQRSPAALYRNTFSVANLNETTLNYLKLKTTKSYIYGLYSGKTHGELETQEKRTADYGTEIHVWDWNGKPIARYKLDKYMFSFSVSSDDEYIVLSSVLDDNKLFRFYLL
jgi:hypothetical protein